jgi:hypothetical protein
MNDTPAADHPEPAKPELGYLYNNGGLNNQKLALFGLFVEARRTGAAVRLPDVFLMSQKVYLEELPSVSQGILNVRNQDRASLNRVFDLEALRGFALRNGVAVSDAPPAGPVGGWDFFGSAGASLVAYGAPDPFACEFFRALIPRIRGAAPLVSVQNELKRRGVKLVMQCRIEKDWAMHTAITLKPTLDPSEDFAIGVDQIVAKIRGTLPREVWEAGIYVVCDEAGLPETKDSIRAQIRQRLGIDLFWKSDFAPGLLGGPPLALAILDFEIAAGSEFFVGLTRSTFSNMAAFERFARTQAPVQHHYIYNLPGNLLGRRTDNGTSHTPEQAVAARS